MKTKEMKPKQTKTDKASSLKEPVTHLKLTPSIQAILSELGIKTVGELVSTPIEKLMSHQKFTSTSLGIVNRDLAKVGLELLDAEGYRATQTKEPLDIKQKVKSAKVNSEVQETKTVEEISKPKKPEKREEVVAIEEEEPMDSLQDLEKQLKKAKKKGIKKGEKLAKRKIIIMLLEDGMPGKVIARITEVKRSVVKKVKKKYKLS